MVDKDNLLFKNYKLLQAHTIGANHVKNNLPYQDAFASFACGDYSLICTADGHGGCDYFRSDRGSKFATEAFVQTIKDAFEKGLLRSLENETKKKDIDNLIKRIESNFLFRWSRRVEADKKANPFSEDEMSRVSPEMKQYYLSNNSRYEIAYGTTFIGAVLCEKFYFAIQLGDGDCLVFDLSQNATHPIPKDSRCVGNLTTSLCDEDASLEFRHYFSSILPLAVFVATDGVDKSFENDEKLALFYKMLLDEVKNGKSVGQVESELNADLPMFSEYFSRDDVTLLSLINDVSLKEA